MILILFVLLNAGFMEIFEEFRQLFDAFNWDVASKLPGFWWWNTAPFQNCQRLSHEPRIHQGFSRETVHSVGRCVNGLVKTPSDGYTDTPFFCYQVYHGVSDDCLPSNQTGKSWFFSVTSMIFHWKSQGIYCRPSAWTAWRARRCSPVQADPMIRCNIAMERSTIFNR